MTSYVAPDCCLTAARTGSPARSSGCSASSASTTSSISTAPATKAATPRNPRGPALGPAGQVEARGSVPLALTRSVALWITTAPSGVSSSPTPSRPPTPWRAELTRIERESTSGPARPAELSGARYPRCGCATTRTRPSPRYGRPEPRRRALLILATGLGKTVVGGEVIGRHLRGSILGRPRRGAHQGARHQLERALWRHLPKRSRLRS